MAADRCANPVASRRRIFWTTQPDACGTEESCGADCGIPGLRFSGDPLPDDLKTGRTFLTTEWLRSIAINMLMTDGKRPNIQCGYRPGAQGGHWSESYRTDGMPIGTLMRTVEPSGRVRDMVNQVRAYAQATMQRLVDLGVAISVNVDAQYLGSSRMQLSIEIIGPASEKARVGLTGQQLANGWVWQ